MHRARCDTSEGTLSVASALNCTYGIVSLTDTLGGLEQVMVGPTSLVSEVIILVNSLDQCIEPCKPCSLLTGLPMTGYRLSNAINTHASSEVSLGTDCSVFVETPCVVWAMNDLRKL